MELIFIEEQRFSRKWIYLLIGSISVLFLFTLLFLEDNMDLYQMLVVVIILVSVFVVLLRQKMVTKINAYGIEIKFVPFVNRFINWDQIEQADIVNYGFIGGWGIRYWTSYGIVYNVKGNMGLAIKLNSGKKLLIGTQQPEKLEKVLIPFGL